MAKSKWKLSYIDFQLINKLKKQNNYIFTKSRNSVILKEFVGLTFNVYNGKQYIKILIIEEMVGFKLGEFVFTRKMNFNIHKKKK